MASLAHLSMTPKGTMMRLETLTRPLFSLSLLCPSPITHAHVPLRPIVRLDQGLSSRHYCMVRNNANFISVEKNSLNVISEKGHCFPTFIQSANCSLHLLLVAAGVDVVDVAVVQVNHGIQYPYIIVPVVAKLLCLVRSWSTTVGNLK